MILNDTLVQAISWTLVHSLWQGILLAVFAGLIILATKKAAASTRYNLLSALFVVFLITVGLTFNYEFTPDLESKPLHLPLVSGQVNGSFNPEGSGFSGTFIGFLNSNAHGITMFWLLIFAFKLLGIFNAFSKIYRIRNYRIFSPSEYWKNRVSELAFQINIHKPIVLLESALIKIPCVTGFFRPMILIPVGLLANLPQDQVEAILLHELAHIRRKDYIINLLQHLAETIFFFNPALLWLSSLIKDERENCCDDIALGVIGNKKDFVHALISFEEYSNHKLAVAFAGKKNHLLQRVKRIVYDDNKSLNAVEKMVLSVSLLLVAAAIVTAANPQFQDDSNDNSVLKSISEVATTVRQTSQTTATTISTSSTTSYEEHIETTDDNEQPATAGGEEQAIPVYSYGYPTAEIVPACKPEPTAMPVAADLSKTTSITTRTVNSKTATAHTLDREVTTYDSENPGKNRQSILRTGITGENLPEDMNVDHLTNNIISDLITEDIIKDSKGLSFKLSGNSLIVNGQKQCETVHAKLKKKYFNPKVSAICYNYEYSGDI